MPIFLHFNATHSDIINMAQLLFRFLPRCLTVNSQRVLRRHFKKTYTIFQQKKDFYAKTPSERLQNSLVIKLDFEQIYYHHYRYSSASGLQGLGKPEQTSNLASFRGNVTNGRAEDPVHFQGSNFNFK